MLNKELLLMGGGESVPYTHTIHVGQDSTIQLYGYSTQPSIGELSPNTVNISGFEREIWDLCTQEVDSYIYVIFHLQYYGPKKNLYFGRSDTKEFVLYYSSDPDQGYIEYSSGNHGVLDIRFSKEDVGKDIPIWISTEPPPPPYIEKRV